MTEKTMEWVFQGVGTSGAILLITLLISMVRVNSLNPFSSKEQEVYSRQSVRSFRRVARYAILLCGVTVYFGLLANSEINKNQLITSYPFFQKPVLPFAFNMFTIVVFLITATFLLVLVSIPPVRKRYFNACTINKARRKKAGTYSLLLILAIGFYIFELSLNYANFLNIILTNANTEYALKQSFTLAVLLDVIRQKDIIFVIVDVILYITLIFPVFKMWSFMYRKRVRVTITLNNGEKFEEMYVLHSGGDGNILIGDKESITSSTKKVIISKQNIQHTEILCEESIFNKSVSLYEKPKSKIILLSNANR